jgi:hypothetical protein
MELDERDPAASYTIEFAEAELARVGLDNPENDFYKGMTRAAVLELLRVFDNQGHSGMSASMVLSIFERLAKFEPISPLTGEDEEWRPLGDAHPNMAAQNIRCGHVFRRADGTSYDSRVRVFVDTDGFSRPRSDSQADITFPYTPRTEYVYAPQGEGRHTDLKKD